MKKKGQMGLESAISVVLIVGLVFLILATLAYIGVKYGDATSIDTTLTKLNDTLTTVDGVGEYLSVASYRNVVCSVLTIQNATSGHVISTNYTATNCLIKSTQPLGGFNNTNWNVSYTYTFDLATVATNVTDDMNTEIKNNSSITGIILTVSLIGIILAVLLGVFFSMRRSNL
jgi:hypothetical protein